MANLMYVFWVGLSTGAVWTGLFLLNSLRPANQSQDDDELSMAVIFLAVVVIEASGCLAKCGFPGVAMLLGSVMLGLGSAAAVVMAGIYVRELFRRRHRRAQDGQPAIAN